MESAQAHRTAFNTADGLSLAVEIQHVPGRPTLLFAHGFGQTRGAWKAAAVTMAARGCRCVTFDSRGHGESGRVPGGDYHMQFLRYDEVPSHIAQKLIDAAKKEKEAVPA